MDKESNATVCPTCLTSAETVLVVVSVGSPCDRCGLVPTTRLTPGEIRACLQNRKERQMRCP